MTKCGIFLGIAWQVGLKVLSIILVVLALILSLLLTACSSPPEAQIVSSTTIGQAPLSIIFTNESRNADHFQWDFGDGTIATTAEVRESVTYEYTKSGTYTVTLTAIKEEEPPKTSTTTLAISVEPGPLERVRLTSEAVEVAAGQAYKLTAEALDAYDNPIPEAQISWEAADGVGTIASDGTLTAATKIDDFPIGITVVATLNNDTDEATAQVIIKHGSLDHVEINPESAEVVAGQTLKFTAKTFDAYDNPIPEAQISWRVAKETGTISDDGVLTATTTIGTFPHWIGATASLDIDTAYSSTPVTIKHGPLDHVNLTPQEVRLGLGQVHRFTAEALDTYGNPIPEALFQWEATGEVGMITTDGTLTTGTNQGTSNGRIVVTTELNSNSATATAEVTVTLLPDPNLEDVIRQKINRYEGPVYIADLEPLTTLEVDEPKGISNLSGLQYCLNLERLDIISNDISDISALASLTDLTYIRMAFNDVSDISAMASLTGLREIIMQRNNIGDISALADLTDIHELVLFHNNIEDISPLNNLTKLSRLHLSENNISDISALAGLTSLYELHLSDNNIRDISGLVDLTNLYRLYLYDNSISDISALAGLTNLYTLMISDNRMKDISPLAGLTNLEVLHLQSNIVSDISALADLTNLDILFLNNNNIGDISALAGLTRLQVLGIADNNVSDISALAGLTKLSSLYLNDNEISDISVLTNLTNLTKLNIENNPLNDESVEVYIPLLEARGVEITR